jgi:sec-independent protein translocase protein TatB
MFGDIGWAELMLIGIVALIVIGPEDLPHMFRQVGRFTAKMRSMSRDFTRAMDQAAKDSGIKDVSDTVKGATSATSVGLSKVKAAADRFEKWDPIKSATVPPATKSPTTAAMPVVAATPLDAEPTIHGPETQALLKRQTAKKAALIKAVEKPVEIQASPSEAAMPDAAMPGTAMPKAVKASQARLAAQTGVDPLTPKPRAARKPKKVPEE